ncbi:MAG TPA: hypothetical protein VFQ30_19915 [Ktedonobacteraceae bacterium]|nr:hypothetical protein [Ktedonobacteraceae bacterium]
MLCVKDYLFLNRNINAALFHLGMTCCCADHIVTIVLELMTPGTPTPGW